MRLTIHGARGSFPVTGPRVRRYGGCTSCFSLETKSGLIVVDAGTGIIPLGEALCARRAIPPITLLFTHLHLDHVAGMPAFRPLYEKRARVTLLADSQVLKDWPRALRILTAKPFWPVNVLGAGGSIRVRSLPRGRSGIELYGVRIRWCPVRHPQGCVSFRLETPGRVIVLASDREAGPAPLEDQSSVSQEASAAVRQMLIRQRCGAGMDAEFLKFCHGADTLIHDAQYTPQEYARRVGWGHSTWAMAARVARQAGAARLILTSHDPARTDEEIDRLVELARGRFPDTRAAAEGMALD